MLSRRLVLVIGVLLLAVMACNAPSSVVEETPVVLEPAPTTIGAAGATATAGPGATTQPTIDPNNPTPTPGVSMFYGPVIFTTDPDSGVGQPAFAAGTEEIWAVWNYANMQDGDVVRRVWYQDGEVWVEREEAWDFARYGANGTVRDVSIYDRDSGLPPGDFTLELYINGVQQILSENTPQAAFRIVLGDGAAVTGLEAPTGTGSVTIEMPGTLVYYSCLTCAPEVVRQVTEIREVVWLPDSEHVVITVIDRSEQFAAPATIGIKYELWVVNITSGDAWQISEGQDAYHYPLVSPDGKWIAALAGTGYGDAGMVDLGLVFIQLDAKYQQVGVFAAQDMAGIPANSRGQIYPDWEYDASLAGEWISATEFRAPLNKTGFDEMAGFPGVWVINVATKTATRVGDLPTP